MTHKQIDGMREARLWIGQVIVPAIGVAAVAMSKPEIRAYVKDKFSNVKNFVKTDIQKLKGFGQK